MRFLHTSDWHFGMSFSGRSIREDQEFFVDRICEVIEEKNIDGVIIAGDIFDRSIASSEAVELYDYAVTRICKELKRSLFIIAGNHDSPERLAQYKELLRDSGLYISGALTGEVDRVELEDVDVYLLPWISTETVRAIYPQKAQEIASLQDAYKVVCDGIRSTLNHDKKNIIVSHAFITKAETSTSDRAAVVGLATQVGAFVFEGFDYVALGHIHKPQDIGENIRYSGTPMPYSFGAEENQIKSVTVLDTADMSREVIPLKQLHVRKTISGDYNTIITGEYPEEIRTGYLHIDLTDTYLTMNTVSGIREKFPNVLEVIGKSIGESEGRISMSLDELKAQENDPLTVFKQFCIDNGHETDDDIIGMFEKAIADIKGEEV